ncbi:MarR family winged helix-turn-helix transcriptional regulator [Rossellomorea aquimaris]|uniref:MarR family winged helix-turn-helix transcriptional regulator n=1 Tax=Rossellomorea aquimaris TaxID=189382 RepID=UPI000B064AC7|nr:MarR family transcriptional regulator [Rossellomorea aquimaris]
MNEDQIKNVYIDRLFRVFQVSNRQIQQDMATTLKELKLTGPQFYILSLLSTTDSTKSTELAEQLDVKPSAITVMIDRLLKNKFVTRERDERDRRIVKLALTSEGKEAFEKAKTLRREIFTRYLSYLEEDDVDRFVSIYEKLAAAIEKDLTE